MESRRLRALRLDLNKWRSSFVSQRPATALEEELAEKLFYLNYLQESMIVFNIGAFLGELTYCSPE